MGRHSLIDGWDLRLYGWRGDDWRGNWMARHVKTTHVTLQVVGYKDGRALSKEDWSLHVDATKAGWYKTKQLTRAYQSKFTLVTSRHLGWSSRTSLPTPTGHMSTAQTIAWWYAGRFLLPSWRPDSCVRQVRLACNYFGHELPDTALSDSLFNL